MFYKEDELLETFKLRYKDRTLPTEVLSQLASYTHRNHFAIKRKEIESILYIGQYENEDEARAVINKAKFQNFIYDHCLAEFNATYFLFQYWFKPFD